ncbi:hypothetical protein V6N13_136965 [Hibiscus sabdariffa]
MKKKTSKEKATAVGVAEDVQMVENLVATKREKKKDKLSKKKRKGKEKINASVGTVDENEVNVQDSILKARIKVANER